MLGIGSVLNPYAVNAEADNITMILSFCTEAQFIGFSGPFSHACRSVAGLLELCRWGRSVSPRGMAVLSDWSMVSQVTVEGRPRWTG